MSADLIACVRFAHSLRYQPGIRLASSCSHRLDSFSSCSDSGMTTFGTTFVRFGSKSVYLDPPLSWNSMVSDQCPVISPISLLPGPLTCPAIALYPPEIQPYVCEKESDISPTAQLTLALKSTSQWNSVSSFSIRETSHSSKIILPNIIPRAYVLGICGVSTAPRGFVGLTVILYSPSCGLSRSRIRSSPSIMVAAELPRNFDFGLSSPVTSTWFLGLM